MWFPLHLTAMGAHMEVAELLIDGGAGLDMVGRGVCSCKRGRLGSKYRHCDDFDAPWRAREFMIFLDREPEVTPVHVALCHKQEDMALMLLQRGAAHTFDEPMFRTNILHTAAAFGCLRVMEFLLTGDDAVDIDVRDSMGLTPLYYAYSTEQEEVMTWLLDSGADLDAQLGGGLTLLHLSCVDGAFHTTYTLVDYGADVNLSWERAICEDLPPLRPLDICCIVPYTRTRYVYSKNPLLRERRFEYYQVELMRMLLDAGASTSPNPGWSHWSKTKNMQISALTLAASYHSISMLDVIAASGADLTAESSAFRAVIYPSFIEWSRIPGRNPIPTLNWLVAHNVMLDGQTMIAIDSLAAACALPEECPWKTDVVEWLVTKFQIPSDTELHLHDFHLPGVHDSGPMYPRSIRSVSYDMHAGTNGPTCAFWEALERMDFSTCRVKGMMAGLA